MKTTIISIFDSTSRLERNEGEDKVSHLQSVYEKITTDIQEFWNSKLGDGYQGIIPVWQSPEWVKCIIASKSVTALDFIGVYSDSERLLGYSFIETRAVGAGFYGSYCIGGPNILTISDSENLSLFNSDAIYSSDSSNHSDSPSYSDSSNHLDSSVDSGSFSQTNPLSQNSTTSQIASTLLKAILENSQNQKSIFSVIESINLDCEFEKNISDCGFVSVNGKTTVKTFIEPYTRCIHLLSDEESILAQMKQKGRYNIRLAEKNGCIAKKVEASSENITIFMKLLEETLERDGFHGNSRRYYENMLQLVNGSVSGLYFVYYGSQVIAAAILVAYGNTATYYYGASTSDNSLRKFMPAYLLQWEMIRESKKAGFTWYDFLGIANPEDDSTALQGVSEFKAKFGGEVFRFPEKKLFVHAKCNWYMFQLLRQVKKLLRKV